MNSFPPQKAVDLSPSGESSTAAGNRLAQPYLRSIVGTYDLPLKSCKNIADINAGFLSRSRGVMTILPAGRFNSDSGKHRDDN